MMHIPSPLPDELAQGFVERIRIVNGFPTQILTIQLLTTWLNETQGIPKNQPLVVRLAAALGVNQMEFIRHHTLLPIHRAVTGLNAHHMHGDPNDCSILIRSGMRLARAGAYSCPECVKEDLSFWGHTYWRISHQLPGVDWCQKHRTSLKHSPLCTFSKLPINREDESPPNATATCMEQDHVDIRRYVDILNGLLDRHKPFPLLATSLTLADRARKVDLRTTAKGNQQTLSDLARQRLPDEWLKKHFPSIKSTHAGKHQTFDSVCRPWISAQTSSHYALALALLFPSAEDALNALTYSDAHLDPQRQNTLNSRVLESQRAS